MKRMMVSGSLMGAMLLVTPAVFAQDHGAHAGHSMHDHAAMDHSAHQSMSGEGVIKRINAAEGKVTIKHGPLGADMPPMTMEFSVKDPSQLADLKKGDKVSFTVNEEMLITEIF